ncbi:MAG: cation transporter [Bacteroidales bacterium]
MILTETDDIKKKRLFKIAYGLSIFTIAYNIIEGLVSTYFGFVDDTLTLFGFGVDSFIEAISAIGIAYMILQIKRNAYNTKSKFEKNALRITGYSFYILSAGLLISATINFLSGSKPQTTFWGIIISCISIAVMIFLALWKLQTGRKLHSEPIIADARCTIVCIYMSVVLLLASGVYELTHFAYADIIGSVGIALLSFKEGKECFEKAKSDKPCSCGCNKNY